METKRKWLEMVIGDIKSLAEWSKTDPDTFNRVVCEQKLRKLEEMASDLATAVEKDDHFVNAKHGGRFSGF